MSNPVPPPVETRFKPGQSGNPAGKKRGTKNWTTVLRKSLMIQVEAEDPRRPGQKKKTRVGEVIQHAQIRQAMKGNTKAYTAIMDRVEGKVTENIQHSGVDGTPLVPPQIIFQGVDAPKEGTDE